jgi:hypothetical protein
VGADRRDPQAARLVRIGYTLSSEDHGPNHAQELQAFADAGVDELYVQQVGAGLDGFFDTWAPYILDRFKG